eukprot:1331888-Amorphochlora_amoeboformis.AAC.1
MFLGAENEIVHIPVEGWREGCRWTHLFRELASLTCILFFLRCESSVLVSPSHSNVSEIPLEHYASLVLAVSVLNTSLQQNLLTRGTSLLLKFLEVRDRGREVREV